MLFSASEVRLVYILALCAIILTNNVRSIDPGKVIKVGLLELHLDDFIRQATAGKGNGSKHLITTDLGCLDAGYWNEAVPEGEIYTPFLNAGCPNNTWNLWHWDGDSLKVGKPPVFDEPEACLDCWKSSINCRLRAFKCNGGPSQKFFVRIHSNRMDVKNRKVYYSIHSKVHPSRCLSWYHIKSDQPPKFTVSKEAVEMRLVFQLQECKGLDHQSFIVTPDMVGNDFEKSKEFYFNAIDSYYDHVNVKKESLDLISSNLAIVLT